MVGAVWRWRRPTCHTKLVDADVGLPSPLAMHSPNTPMCLLAPPQFLFCLEHWVEDAEEEEKPV